MRQAARAKGCAKDQSEMTEIGQQLRKAAQILRQATDNKGNTVKVRAMMTQVVNSLSVVMSASSVDEASKSKLAALLQQEDDDDDSGMPQATQKRYDTHSRGIMELISELNAQNENDLQDSMRSCSEDNHNFNMIIQAARTSVGSMSDRLEEVRADQAEATETQADAQKRLTAAVDQLSEDKKVQTVTQHNCDDGEKTQAAEQKSRAEETRVIQETIDILSGKDVTTGGGAGSFASFLQLRSDDLRVAASSEIAKLASRYRAVNLAQLAVAVRDGPFDKVMGTIHSRKK